MQLSPYGLPPCNPPRARRRAEHLTRRAMRRPVGSNGRRKDLLEAANLMALAAATERAHGVAAAAREAETADRVSALKRGDLR